VAYRSTDAAGNVEATRSGTVRIATLSMTATGVYRKHKLSSLRASWAAVAGATTYSILMNEVVVSTTSDLTASVPVPANLRSGNPLVRVVPYDGAARQLAVGAERVAAY
jgi:hypothetical protein